MTTLYVCEFLTDPILVTREAARVLEEPLRSAMQEKMENGNTGDTAAVTIDFKDVAGVAPSFMDELLQIFESHLDSKNDEPGRSLIIANPPTRISSKFEAIARGHRITITSVDDGSWFLKSTNDPLS